MSKQIPEAHPYAIERPNLIPAQRYYDARFYALECERLWPRVWQMACRLEEIPNPGDFVVYDILDQSVIIARVDEKTVRAYHNACRHRGVQLVRDRGHCAGVLTCPFHGWQFGLDGKCRTVYSTHLFERELLRPDDLRLRECRLELWGGCAFINFDDQAPPLRASIEPFATMHDAWHVESLRTEWWLAARLPVNWKLAMEAFMEGYHVMTTHPQLLTGPPDPLAFAYREMPPDVSPMTRFLTVPTQEMPTEVGSREFIEMNIHFMRVLNEGMAGMTHRKDIEVAETLREAPLPPDITGATMEWRRKLNDAVVEFHKANHMDICELNELSRQFSLRAHPSQSHRRYRSRRRLQAVRRQ